MTNINKPLIQYYLIVGIIESGSIATNSSGTWTSKWRRQVKSGVHPAIRVEHVVLNASTHVLKWNPVWPSANLVGGCKISQPHYFTTDGIAKHLFGTGKHWRQHQQGRGSTVKQLERGVIDTDLVEFQEHLGRSGGRFQNIRHIGHIQGRNQYIKRRARGLSGSSFGRKPLSWRPFGLSTTQAFVADTSRSDPGHGWNWSSWSSNTGQYPRHHMGSSGQFLDWLIKDAKGSNWVWRVHFTSEAQQVHPFQPLSLRIEERRLSKLFSAFFAQELNLNQLFCSTPILTRNVPTYIHGLEDGMLTTTAGQNLEERTKAKESKRNFRLLLLMLLLLMFPAWIFPRGWMPKLCIMWPELSKRKQI